jgi:hypothetical protein
VRSRGGLYPCMHGNTVCRQFPARRNGSHPLSTPSGGCDSEGSTLRPAAGNLDQRPIRDAKARAAPPVSGTAQAVRRAIRSGL